MKILIPIPSYGFDPTETAVPWSRFKESGHHIVFSTPEGKSAHADQRMLSGESLGIWRKVLIADKLAIRTYEEMRSSSEFKTPLSWGQINQDDFDALFLPGGHDPGMKEYLDSTKIQSVTSSFFEWNKPVGAICHGVIVAARARRSDGKSVLYDKKTTCLLKTQELAAWSMTCLWLGNYYRTYPETVQDEVVRNLKNKTQFISGPSPLFRDDPKNLRGFCVHDGNYLSARWPGDTYTFSEYFLEKLRGAR